MSSLDDIREALAAATPGPWDATYDPADRWTSITGQQYGEYVCPEVATCEGDVGTDAHLIANAPTWLAELLAEVDSTRRELGDVHVSLYSEIAMLTARAEAAEQAIQRVREFAEQGREFADRTMDDAAAHWARSAADGIFRALDGR